MAQVRSSGHHSCHQESMACANNVIAQAPEGFNDCLQSDGNSSDKIDSLAEFEETEKTRKIVVGRAMKHKAPISTEKWDNVAKDKNKIVAAFEKFMYYLSEFNSQMTKATAEAAPTQHSLVEAKFGQDLGKSFRRSCSVIPSHMHR